MSRQIVNSNLNSKNNKNSNQSAKSAQLQQLSQGVGQQQLAQNFSMELAAKNLKLMGNQQFADNFNAPTRNSNL